MANPSMNPKHIIVYPSDGTGCGMYRMIWPGVTAKQAGVPVTVSQKSAKIYVDSITKQIRGVDVGSAAVAVFQRPGSIQISQVIPILQGNGRKVVIDMDDSLSKINPRNPAYRTYDPRANHKINWMHAAKACELADLVTVTTEALAEEYGKHGRVKIIPNHVPQKYLSYERQEHEAPVIGWTGYTATHVDDLRVTRGMINQVLTDTGAKFIGFGDKEIFNQLGIRLRPPHELWGFTNILEYPRRLAAGFDIGLVPLQPNDFNEAKSWLKGLEYASLGIVPVVTPIGDYKNLIDLGMALPASTPKEWYDTVKMLVLDNEMRVELSKQVREIAAGWTIEGNISKWTDAWNLQSNILV